MDEYALQLQNISKYFGSVAANKNIDLTLRKGEILALLGENGSGKTTLMNMISGIYYPDEGRIFVNGEEARISSPQDAFRYKIGMVHQHFKLIDIFTAAQNIVLGTKGSGLARINEEVKAIAEKYGFEIDPKRRSTICPFRKSRRWRSSKCSTAARTSSSSTSPRRCSPRRRQKSCSPSCAP